MLIISEHNDGPLQFFNNIIEKSSSVKILLNKVDDDDNDNDDDIIIIIIMAVRHRRPFSQFLFLGEAAQGSCMHCRLM